jgi:hypothetical protein
MNKRFFWLIASGFSNFPFRFLRLAPNVIPVIGNTILEVI